MAVDQDPGAVAAGQIDEGERLLEELTQVLRIGEKSKTRFPWLT